MEYLLDCTTACVCSEVPEAMLVKAQAASNCKDGLQDKRAKVQLSDFYILLFWKEQKSST